MEKLTREQAVLIGIELRRVCETASFAKVIGVLKDQYQDQFFGSTINDTAARDNAYAQSSALDELIITFNSFIAIADADLQDVVTDDDETLSNFY